MMSSMINLHVGLWMSMLDANVNFHRCEIPSESSQNLGRPTSKTSSMVSQCLSTI